MRYPILFLFLIFFRLGFSQDICCPDNCCHDDCPDPKPKEICPPCFEITIIIVGSFDPNDIIPPESVGAEGWIRRDRELTFMVQFENDPNMATAPAQRVEVVVPLDSQVVDLSSLKLGDFGFGSFYFQLPPDTQAWSDTLLTADSVGVNVSIDAFLDTANNQAKWIFQSLDTITNMPPLDPFAGFLPVNDTSLHNGEGFFYFSFMPHPASQTFDQIHTYANIFFDLNPPIVTPMALNTVDANAPQSTIDTIFFLPGNYRHLMILNGADVGSGLKNYTVFYSENDADYKPLAIEYAGDSLLLNLTPGVNYKFITIARDSVLNVEPTKLQEDYTYIPPDNALNIELTQGWNLISSFFAPVSPDMISVFNPLGDTLIITKDYLGSLVLPSIPLNGIGDWDTRQGYQVKVTEDIILPILGSQVEPELTAIPIQEGWQILPYLRDQPGNLQEELADIDWSTIILKDNNGNVYYPALDIDNIQVLQPTQGYWFKSISDGALFYSPNAEYLEPPAPPTPVPPSFFILPGGKNTGSNASFIIPYEVLMNSPVDFNDEIGIFTPDGTLVGSAVFTGQPLAFPIWGDDSETDNTDGLYETEEFVMRIWDRSEGMEIEETTFTLEEGARRYYNNGIYIASSISLTPNATSAPQPEIYFKYYPNPTTGKVNFSLGLPQAAQVGLSIYSLDGRYARPIRQEVYGEGLHEFSEDLSGLPNGLYVIRVVSGGMSRAYKLVLSY